MGQNQIKNPRTMFSWIVFCMVGTGKNGMTLIKPPLLYLSVGDWTFLFVFQN